MIKLRSRLVSLALAGLMAGQAVLPVWAAEAEETAVKDAVVEDTGKAAEDAEAGDTAAKDTGKAIEDTGAENSVENAGEASAPDETESEGAQETPAESTNNVTPAEGAEVPAEKDSNTAETPGETTENEVMVLAAEDEVTADGETDAIAVVANGAGGIPGSTGGVLFPQNSDGTLTIAGQHYAVGTNAHETIDTVDSTSLGVRMYMFNYPLSAEFYSERFYEEVGDGTDEPFRDVERDRYGQHGAQPLLGADGFPVSTKTGGSLKDRFDVSSGANNATQVNHLFSQQIYDETGYLSYDCLENYAYLDQSTGNFRVYKDIGVPWWGHHSEDGDHVNWTTQHETHGQFFPYNDLTGFAETWSTQVTNADGTEMSSDDSRYGRTLYRADGFKFFFGMLLETDFVQPIDGQVKAGNMRYEFTGDDLMWVYIDGVLVLDTGCRDASDGNGGAGSGYIDFATGEVYVASQDKSTTIRQIYEEAGVADRVQWNGNTYADYSEHELKMFYAEAYGYCSNLQVRLNLVTIPDNQVEKHAYNQTGQIIDGQAVEAGDVLTYTVTAENPASVAKEVTIIDALPEGVEFVSAENGGSYADGKVTWQQSLAAGAKRTVSCKVRVKEAAVGTTLTNTAIEQVGQIAIRTNEVSNPVNSRYQIKTEVVNGTITEPVSNIRKGSDQQISYAPKEDHILESITVDGKAVDTAQSMDSYTFQSVDADHAIKVVYVKVKAPIKAVYNEKGTDINGQEIEIDDVITYRITAENPTAVTKEVLISDTLPEGVEFVSAENDGSLKNGKITWIVSIPAGKSQTVSCKVRVKAAAVGTTIHNAADMTMDKVTSKTNEVTNKVNSRYRIATEVVHGTISESVSNIRKGTAQTVTYKAEGGYLLDSVTVDGKAVDTAAYENSYTFANITEDHIIKAVYVAVVDPVKAVTDQNGKDMTYQHFSDGDEVIYSITVTNPSGLSQDITVTDDVPSALSIQKVSDDGKVKDQKVTWTLQNVGAHASKTVTITAKAIGTYDLQTVENQALMNIAGYQRNTNKVVVYIKAKERPRDNGGNSGGGSDGGTRETKEIITKIVTETIQKEVPAAAPVVEPVAASEEAPAQEPAMNASATPGDAAITTGDSSMMLVYAGIAAMASLILAGWAVHRKRSMH